MKRPRVLLITGSLGFGGTELAVIRLARGLAARGRFEPRVALLGSGGTLSDELRLEGIAVDELGIHEPIRSFGALRKLLRLARLTRRQRIDIVHTFLFDADFYGMLAARLGRPRVVITTRRALKTDRPHHVRGYRRTNFLVDAIVANSEAVRQFTLQRENAPVEKVRVIPNGIDVGRFSSGDRTRFRKRLGINGSTVVMGTVGNIKEVKGQAVLVRAVAPLLRRRQDLRLLMAGEAIGRYSEELRRLVQEDGLKGKVMMPGIVTEIPDLLAALDLFVLPSLSEGMSNALIEAMAAGRAIVATDVGGNLENLGGGQAGVLVPAGDQAGLRREIERLLDNVAERAALGERAARRARQEYSLEPMLDRTEHLYDELLERCSPTLASKADVAQGSSPVYFFCYSDVQTRRTGGDLCTATF